ncbi:MAG: hypothetical protein AAGM22_22365 [Acidobacteriota bacterium]
MSKAEGSPTMIIPSGTEIQIDVHGQLSVRTPGNLVIQNSGHYGEIESVHGSIRIEANAEVEAVSVKCAETCYVQGSLTSWKVKAKSINLEEQAQARVVLQETEAVEIGRNAKLVGNFSSEKELFLLFSRFAQQLKSLPFYFDRGKEQPPALSATEAGPPPVPMAEDAVPLEVPSLSSRVLEAGQKLPDPLFFSLVLLEREARNEAYGSTSLRVVDELVKLLRERDLDALRHTHRTLFGRVVEPSGDLLRARELIEGFFAQHPEAPDEE